MVLGFDAAPVSQAVSLCLVVSTFTSRQYDAGSIEFNLEKIMNGEFHRLFSSFFTFSGTPQLLVGIMLFYAFRQFERQWGSRKFGAFTFLTFVLGTILLAGVTTVGESMDIAFKPTSGPYVLIFALMMMYFGRVPTLSPSSYGLFGLTISEKTWVYLLALIFGLSELLNTIVPAFVGMFIGYLYNNNLLGIQSFRLPAFLDFLFNLVGNLLGIFLPTGGPAPIEDHSVAAAAVQAAAAASDGADDSEGEGADTRVRQTSWSEATAERLSDFGGLGEAIAPPTEEQIKTITSLGFDRTKAIHALEQTGNNVEMAANFCLQD